MKRRKHAALRGRQMFLQLSDWCRRCQYFITMTKDLKFLFPKCPLQSKWSPQRWAAYLKWPEKQPLTLRVRCKDDVRPQKRFVFSCDEQLLFFWWLLNPWEQHSKPFSLVWMTSCWIIQTSLRFNICKRYLLFLVPMCSFCTSEMALHRHMLLNERRRDSSAWIVCLSVVILLHAQHICLPLSFDGAT